jgi:hypothetical protein
MKTSNNRRAHSTAKADSSFARLYLSAIYVFLSSNTRPYQPREHSRPFYLDECCRTKRHLYVLSITPPMKACIYPVCFPADENRRYSIDISVTHGIARDQNHRGDLASLVPTNQPIRVSPGEFGKLLLGSNGEISTSKRRLETLSELYRQTFRLVLSIDVIDVTG